MNKLEKGYTKKELNEFMQALHKAGGKARRTPDGGWEVYEPVEKTPETQVIPKPEVVETTPEVVEKIADPVLEVVETSTKVATSDDTKVATSENSATSDKNSATQPKKGFWKRLRERVGI